MPRGPLPDPHAVRRNAATIPTTNLPVEGRTGPPPELPEWCSLGPAGLRFWLWAWATPEAAAWSLGAVGTVARRASLEDDLAAIDVGSMVPLSELIGPDMLPDDAQETVEMALRTLAKLAGGRLGIVREMGKLDTELGLTPKASAALRWKVVGDKAPATGPTNPVASAPEPGMGSRGRLKVVNGDGGA